jgi:hypothetical protein
VFTEFISDKYETEFLRSGKKRIILRELLLLLLLLLLEYVYPTEQVQLRDRRIAREKKYIQITLPKDVKRMLMYVIIFAHGI